MDRRWSTKEPTIFSWSSAGTWVGHCRTNCDQALGDAIPSTAPGGTLRRKDPNVPFRLTYRGPLSANGGPAQKHALRRHFHQQLKHLWSREPLLSYASARGGYLRCDAGAPGRAIYPLDGVNYACLITERLFLHCELDILFLRPSPPGALIGTGGDIDNRMKTLFDGLRRPLDSGEVSDGGAALQDDPFHCLLSDDALISKVGITTDQLLEPADERNVTVRPTASVEAEVGGAPWVT